MRHSIFPILVLLVTAGAATFSQAQTETPAKTQPPTDSQPQAESQAQESSHKMFDFSAGNAGQWQIVNDGVMGGLSSSKAAMIEGGRMRFSGTLSLENNGGFASVRSKTKPLGLKPGDAIKIRAKGDGRKYTFNLYVPTRQIAFSYQKDFETKANEWTEITLPLSEFQAKSFGQSVDQPLDPTQINSVGVLLGDKKEGAFEIAIDWIKVASEN